MHFVFSVSNRGVLVLFKEKGTYYHYKGRLTSDSTGMVVSAKKDDLNRWENQTLAKELFNGG